MVKNSKQPARLALVLAAERLFAVQGFASVSLRQVQEAAGVRNTSAVHYHFGSRDELVRAVFDHRFAAVNPHRIEIMRQLERDGRLDDTRALVGAMIYPLAPELEPRPEGNHYLRFLDRFLRDHPIITRRDATPLTEGWQWMERELRRTLEPFGKTMVTLRVNLARLQTFAGLASIEADLVAGAVRPRQRTLMVEVLIDAVVAALTGPVAPTTAQALKSTGRRKA